MLNKKLRILSAAILTVGVGLGVVSCGDPSTTSVTDGTTQGGNESQTSTWNTSYDKEATIESFVKGIKQELTLGEGETTLPELVIGCSSEDEPYVNQIITNFKEDYPEIADMVTFTINNQAGEANAFEQFTVSVDDAPDVLLSADDQLIQIILNGYVQPIPESLHYLMAQELNESAFSSCRVDGKVYGYPAVGGNSQLMMYRADLIEDPNNLDDILDIAKENNMDFYFPTSEGWYISDWLWLTEGDMYYEIETTQDELGMEIKQSVQKTTFTLDGLKEVGMTLSGYFSEYENTFMTTNGTDIAGILQAGLADGSVIGGICWNNYDAIIGSVTAELLKNDASLNQETAKAKAESMIGIAKLPTVYHNGEEKQLETWDSYKVYMAKGATKLPRLANFMAYYFTTEQSQALHYDMRQYFPTNKAVLESEAVKNSKLARALTDIAPYTHSQAAGLVGNDVWTGLQTFGVAFSVPSVEDTAATSAATALFTSLGGVLA